jgi:hypothetical protein
MGVEAWRFQCHGGGAIDARAWAFRRSLNPDSISCMVQTMLLRRSLRRWLSGWLVLAVLFTQLATAAYACPMATTAAGQGGESADRPAMPCAAMMSGAAGLRLDTEQPGLCMQHCWGGSQTFDNANPASIPAPTPLPTLTVRAQEPAGAALPAWAAHRRSRDSAPPLPHSIDHCCYRI